MEKIYLLLKPNNFNKTIIISEDINKKAFSTKEEALSYRTEIYETFGNVFVNSKVEVYPEDDNPMVDLINNNDDFVSSEQYFRDKLNADTIGRFKNGNILNFDNTMIERYEMYEQEYPLLKLLPGGITRYRELFLEQLEKMVKENKVFLDEDFIKKGIKVLKSLNVDQETIEKLQLHESEYNDKKYAMSNDEIDTLEDSLLEIANSNFNAYDMTDIEIIDKFAEKLDQFDNSEIPRLTKDIPTSNLFLGIKFILKTWRDKGKVNKHKRGVNHLYQQISAIYDEIIITQEELIATELLEEKVDYENATPYTKVIAEFENLLDDEISNNNFFKHLSELNTEETTQLLGHVTSISKEQINSSNKTIALFKLNRQFLEQCIDNKICLIDITNFFNNSIITSDDYSKIIINHPTSLATIPDEIKTDEFLTNIFTQFSDEDLEEMEKSFDFKNDFTTISFLLKSTKKYADEQNNEKSISKQNIQSSSISM